MKKTITIRIDEEALAKVKALAKTEQRSVGSVIRLAVEKYLKEKK